MTKKKNSARVPTPTLAIVGRPNVGKSTLFNRLVGSRRSIVGDEPGITRDRIYGESVWNGREIRVVDTGGIIPEDRELIPQEIYSQAKVALEEADAIILVVDGRGHATSTDMELARRLLRGGKPVFLAVNKMDSPKLYAEAEEFRRLGIKNMFPISAEHSMNVAELLEAAMAAIPLGTAPESIELEPEAEAIEELAAEPEAEGDGKSRKHYDRIPEETKVAIIGRPNVGKSTLLNRLTGSSRAIVSPVAGTTRDAVDELVVRDGQKYRFIDTAGIRRKGKTKLMAEKLSVVMAVRHLRMSHVAVLVLDATEGVLALDATIAGYAHEEGRALILCVNKWDTMESGKRKFIEQIRERLKFVEYAPVLFVSAKEGSGVRDLFARIRKGYEAASRRIGTGELNRFLETLRWEFPVRIKYLTQPSFRPPTFVVFTDSREKLHFSAERYLINRLREKFAFDGTPIVVKTKQKEREAGRKSRR